MSGYTYAVAAFTLVALIRNVMLRRRVAELERVLSQIDKRSIGYAVDRLEDGPPTLTIDTAHWRRWGKR